MGPSFLKILKPTASEQRDVALLYTGHPVVADDEGPAHAAAVARDVARICAEVHVHKLPKQPTPAHVPVWGRQARGTVGVDGC